MTYDVPINRDFDTFLDDIRRRAAPHENARFCFVLGKDVLSDLSSGLPTSNALFSLASLLTSSPHDTAICTASSFALGKVLSYYKALHPNRTGQSDQPNIIPLPPDGQLDATMEAYLMTLVGRYHFVLIGFHGEHRGFMSFLTSHLIGITSGVYKAPFWLRDSGDRLPYEATSFINNTQCDWIYDPMSFDALFHAISKALKRNTSRAEPPASATKTRNLLEPQPEVKPIPKPPATRISKPAPEPIPESPPNTETTPKPPATLHRYFREPDASLRHDVFVIMPFSDDYAPVYTEYITQVCERLNLSCNRADNINRTGAIMQDVWSEIHHAKIVVCDCSSRNANVFYELGMTHALSKACVCIAQSKDDIPFDIQHLRYIHYDPKYKGPEKLMRDLAKAIIEELR